MSKALKEKIKFDCAQFSNIRFHYAIAGNSEKLVLSCSTVFPKFWHSWLHQLVALSDNSEVHSGFLTQTANTSSMEANHKR